MDNNLRGAIEAKIKAILVSELKVDAESLAGNDSNLSLLGKGIGLDSIEMLILVAEIEKAFDVEIADAEFKADLFESLHTLSGFIMSKLS
jgi:acyl carrier protein